MIQELLLGITKGIRAVFGEEAPVYADKSVAQGLETPCFFIAVLCPEEKPLLPPRFIRRYPVDIQYYPRDPNDLGECYDAAERLFEAANVVTLSNRASARGLMKKFEIAEGVVIFHVCFDFILTRGREPQENMSELKTGFALGGD